MFDTPITTNDQSIDRVLAAGLPVLLVFLDGPMPQSIEQTLNRLARENAGKALIAKIQMRENQGSAGRYQIVKPPSVVAFRSGQVEARGESVSASDLEAYAAFLLGKGPKPQQDGGLHPGKSRQENGRSSAPTSRDGKSNPSTPFAVTDASFEREVMGSRTPVLVDFWAPWCGPCRMTEPVLEKLAHEMSGRLVVAKVNVDENPLVSQRYGVQSIPTMMVVHNGQVLDRWIGALPEANLRSRLAALKL